MKPEITEQHRLSICSLIQKIFKRKGTTLDKDRDLLRKRLREHYKSNLDADFANDANGYIQPDITVKSQGGVRLTSVTVTIDWSGPFYEPKPDDSCVIVTTVNVGGAS